MSRRVWYGDRQGDERQTSTAALNCRVKPECPLARQYTEIRQLRPSSGLPSLQRPLFVPTCPAWLVSWAQAGHLQSALRCATACCFIVPGRG